MDAVRDTLQDLKVNVTLLNITQLSEYRKDGHTSVYTERQGKLLTFEQRSQPEIYADCVHWCLPGVPDTWNEILYMYLLYGPSRHWMIQHSASNSTKYSLREVCLILLEMKLLINKIELHRNKTFSLLFEAGISILGLVIDNKLQAAHWLFRLRGNEEEYTASISDIYLQ